VGKPREVVRKQQVNNMKMTKAGQKKVGKVMSEYKEGTLHSGKGGKVVKNPKQAIAIAISEGAKQMGRYKGK
jgi:hypothetical protein